MQTNQVGIYWQLKLAKKGSSEYYVTIMIIINDTEYIFTVSRVTEDGSEKRQRGFRSNGGGFCRFLHS